MSDEILYIIIPAYNEEANIEAVVDQWYPVVERYHGEGMSRLVTLNDGSQDATLAYLMSLAESRPLMRVIDKKNSGHGATIYEGYILSLANGADFIFQTDSDGQTSPKEFNSFWNERKTAGAVIGSRHLRQDGVSRIFVTKVLKLVVRVVMGVDAADSNCPYRLIGRKALEDALGYVPEKFNLTNVALTAALIKRGWDISFKSIEFKARQGGTNSINFVNISKIGIRALRDLRLVARRIDES